jgi:hypothetical protein
MSEVPLYMHRPLYRGDRRACPIHSATSWHLSMVCPHPPRSGRSPFARCLFYNILAPRHPSPPTLRSKYGARAAPGCRV